MKKTILMMFVVSFFATSSYASRCFTSDVTPEFDSRYNDYSVDIPKLICVKHARAIFTNPRSATVETEVLVGAKKKKVTARSFNITRTANGEMIVKYELLADSDGSFCDENVGYTIDVAIKFNANGIAKELVSLKGYAYSTYDNCHDTSPEYIDLEFETVNYIRD